VAPADAGTPDRHAGRRSGARHIGQEVGVRPVRARRAPSTRVPFQRSTSVWGKCRHDRPCSRPRKQSVVDRHVTLTNRECGARPRDSASSPTDQLVPLNRSTSVLLRLSGSGSPDSPTAKQLVVGRGTRNVVQVVGRVVRGVVCHLPRRSTQSNDADAVADRVTPRRCGACNTGEAPHSGLPGDGRVRHSRSSWSRPNGRSTSCGVRPACSTNQRRSNS